MFRLLLGSGAATCNGTSQRTTLPSGKSRTRGDTLVESGLPDAKMAGLRAGQSTAGVFCVSSTRCLMLLVSADPCNS